MTPRIVVSENKRDLKSFSGNRAESPAARSAKMNPVMPTTLVTYMAIERPEPQPQSRPFSATKSIGTTPRMIVTAPHQSILLLFGWCGTCKKLTTSISAAMPIGMFIRNTQRQPEMKRIWLAPAKRPPISGPRTLEVPKTARNIPWYLARSRGGTMSAKIVSDSENKPPAPIP